MDTLPVIDAHQHLWDPATGWYGWLSREPEILHRRFVFDDARAAIESLGVVGTVLVQAADRDEDTDAMLAEAAGNPVVLGVVGYVPLEQPERTADRLAALRGLPFDLVAVLPRHLEHVGYLSDRFPGLTVVIDHLAKPAIGTDQRQPWYDLMAPAAANPRVVAKVSGLYRQGDGPPATDDDLRPWIADAVELFGPDRLLVGSDWPVAEVEGGYERVTGAVIRVIRSLLGETEAARVLAGTAAEIYDLEVPTGS